MRALRVLSVVAGLVAVALPAPARAELVAHGVLCNRADLGGPRPPEVREDTLYAGPVTLVDDTAGPVTATIVCTVRDGGSHAAPALASAESDPGTGVVALPPTTVSYLDLGYTAICTELRIVGGPTLYYDAGSRAWTTDPATLCEPSLDVIGPDPYLPDAVLCPLLTGAFPPDGDVPGVWDCPPYGGS
jgi:hypothetical protein